MEHIFRRLRQPSTWCGLAVIALQISTGNWTPEVATNLVAAIGLVGADA